MNLKVVHLLNHLDWIERDLKEIAGLESALQDDRTYSQRVRQSLRDEALRLQELQRKILGQVIKNPPKDISPAASKESTPTVTSPQKGKVNADQPAAEVIVPSGNGSARTVKESPRPDSRNRNRPRKSNRTERNGDAESGSDREKGDTAESTDETKEDFPFRFIQN
ncbi:MAG: hypothetical protein KDK34_07210 [Leptospiraceae bacterium]|nr:hypothetical protein [Leptospiraceae bacterium]MCB1320023.1 hypothetical protein [Leptospiraceae bacterium]